MKIIRRVLFGILTVAAVLIVFLVGSVFIDILVGRDRLDAIANTTFTNLAGDDVRAYIAQPEGSGPFPAVIMIHEFWGLNKDITEKAEALAEEGYFVIAPDMFRGSTTSWIPRAIYQVITTPEKNLVEDLDVVFTGLESDPQIKIDKVGIVGFCFGGRTSLLYSLANDRLAATIVLYGSPETDPEVLASLPGPLLGIFGGADTSIPIENVETFDAALDAAGIPNEIIIYEGEGHAFVSSMEAVRAGGAPGQAWEQIIAFFAHTLQEEGAFHQLNTLEEVTLGRDWRYLAFLAFEHSIFGSASHHH